MKKYFVCMQFVYEGGSSTTTTYIVEREKRITTSEQIYELESQLFSEYMKTSPDAKVVSHMIISISKL